MDTILRVVCCSMYASRLNFYFYWSTKSVGKKRRVFFERSWMNRLSILFYIDPQSILYWSTVESNWNEMEWKKKKIWIKHETSPSTSTFYNNTNSNDYDNHPSQSSPYKQEPDAMRWNRKLCPFKSDSPDSRECAKFHCFGHFIWYKVFYMRIVSFVVVLFDTIWSPRSDHLKWTQWKRINMLEETTHIAFIGWGQWDFTWKSS